MFVRVLSGERDNFFYNLNLNFEFEFYSARKVSAQVFSALFPNGNYKIKFNQPFDASGRCDTAI